MTGAAHLVTNWVLLELGYQKTFLDLQELPYGSLEQLMRYQAQSRIRIMTGEGSLPEDIIHVWKSLSNLLAIVMSAKTTGIDEEVDELEFNMKCFLTSFASIKT